MWFVASVTSGAGTPDVTSIAIRGKIETAFTVC
jgi:hypothetical protein